MQSKILISLGQVVITKNASKILSDTDVNTALARHVSGDWGELCDCDKKANDDALKYGGRVLSVYMSTDNHKFWVLTEADRSYTTVLMPSDY